MNISNNLLSYKSIQQLYLWSGFIISEIIFITLGMYFKIPILIILVTTLSLLLIFFFVEPKSLPLFFIFSLIFTEFYWIEVIKGYLKPFHLFAVFLFISYTIFYMKYFFHSKIVRLLIAFVIINLIAILFSASKIDSLRSFVLPLILISIGLNVAIILYNSRISIGLLQNVILYGTFIAICFGFVQMLVYRILGLSLNLTEVQFYQIISAKRPPSFFTEADTFGKFLSLPFFLFLPFALHSSKIIFRKYKIFILIIFAAIIMNMTRSAMIGIGITLIIYMIYSLKQKSIKRNLIILTSAIGVLLMVLPITLTILKAIGSYDELYYRYETLTNPSLLMSSGSPRFRRIATMETIKGVTESTKSFLLGYGWGQSYIYIWDIPRDVGGNLFLNILYYGGFVALVVFVAICCRIVKLFQKFANIKGNCNTYLFSEGLMFSFICMTIISQLASMWIAPEFWLVVGIAIYFELEIQKRHNLASSFSNQDSNHYAK